MSPIELAYRGVIEGFYGRPWTPVQRLHLLERQAAWGMNVFVYGPKDDVKIRAAWREPYDADELARLEELARSADERAVALHCAIAPGLDIRYSDASDRDALIRKVDQLLDAGARGISLLFDDIPSALPAEDAGAFASFAHAQADVANHLVAHLDGRVPLIFCPTEYCDRFARPSVDESPYLNVLGELLDPRSDVYWTGPEIVSEAVPVEATRRFARVLRRPPVLWDNLHANDYDGRRMYLGPYAGRPPELRGELRGVITNPNVEYEANFVPLHTTAAWMRGGSAAENTAENAAASAARAVDDWLPRFATHGGHASRRTIELLIDYLHLPFQHGPLAREHLAAAARVARGRANRGDRELLAARERELRDAYVRVTELRDRELAYALYARAWDLKEEAEVLARYAAAGRGAFCRPEALANTYRTGILDDLQRLLPLDDRGCVA